MTRHAFQHRLAACGQPIRVIKPPRRYRGGFALAVRLRVRDVAEQTISIVFGPGAPDVPGVYTDGPSESPHRYIAAVRAHLRTLTPWWYR